MSTKYPGIPNPRKDDLSSMYRTVVALKAGYEALVGVPKESSSKVLNQEDIQDVNKRIDMYEPTQSGTWTPEYACLTTSPIISYGTQNGYYTRVGDLVYISADIRCITVTSAGSGQILVAGMPFAQYDTGSDWNATFNIAYWNSWDALPVSYRPSLMWRSDEAAIRLYRYRAEDGVGGGPGSSGGISAATFRTGGTFDNRLIFSGVYRGVIE